LPRHGDISSKDTRIGLAEALLADIKNHGIPNVVGFVNAKKIEEDPSLIAVLKLWIVQGQTLGNHTFSHPDFSKISAEDFISEIERDEPVLDQVSVTRA
jgi:peptidoglycan/xylan/chitin deacetylase (PgdA/CDA1 family)